MASKPPPPSSSATKATKTTPALLYANRTLRSASNTPNGEVSALTIFHYSQSPLTPHIVSATYSGGSIVQGSLIGTVASATTDSASHARSVSADAKDWEDAKIGVTNVLTMVYQHVNVQGKIMTGKCVSTPEVLDDGRLRLWEEWEWTSGGEGKGKSVVEEIEEGKQ